LTAGEAAAEAPWSRASFARAVEAARGSLEDGGVPVGAALDIGSELVAVGHNERVQRGDPIAHGEIACLRKAGRQTDYRDAVLYTTLSPCAMCSGAILLFGIPLVVVGENRTFEGDLPHLERHGVEIVLLDDPCCVGLMTEFQARHPRTWAEDIGQVAAL
jgi:cytosine deaminase